MIAIIKLSGIRKNSKSNSILAKLAGNIVNYLDYQFKKIQKAWLISLSDIGN